MKPNQKNTTVTIVGAGLTGLTIAYYLSKAGIDINVLEKNDQTGGVIQSKSESGFTWECGPNTGVIGNPIVAELFEDLEDSCKLEVANPAAKRRLILKNGKWEALPSGLISAVRTPLFTLKDKFRILLEPFRKKGTNPMESLADMVKRRLGKSFLDYAVDPFISGVYAGNPNKLITQFALPKLYNLEQNYGSFIKGSIKKRKEPKKPGEEKATKDVFSAKGGLGNFITAITEKIGKNNIEVNSIIENISFEDNNYTIKYKIDNKNYYLKSKYLITTSGGDNLTTLLNFIPSKELTDIVSLNYAKIVQVIMGFKDWKGIPLNAFGGLIPSKEKRKILGVLFTSSFFENRAPDEGALLSVFMGGTNFPEAIELSDSEIKQLVMEEINELMQINNLTPDLFRIYKYRQAIPQYEASTEKRLERIDKMESRYPGLFIAGNIRNGIGMADRIKQGKDIADKIIEEKRRVVHRI